MLYTIYNVFINNHRYTHIPIWWRSQKMLLRHKIVFSDFAFKSVRFKLWRFNFGNAALVWFSVTCGDDQFWWWGTSPSTFTTLGKKALHFFLQPWKSVLQLKCFCPNDKRRWIKEKNEFKKKTLYQTSLQKKDANWSLHSALLCHLNKN